MYQYSVDIEKIKAVHALTLISIASYLIHFTRKFKLLNQSHYMQILILSILVMFVYFLPIFYIIYSAYRDAGDSYYSKRLDRLSGVDTPDWETAMIKFADWVFMIL